MKKIKFELLLVCITALLFGGTQITVGVSPASPSNDNCFNAKLVGNVTDLAFDTTNATFDGPGHCMNTENSANIWYCYTATCTGIATVSLCDSDYDTRLAVYDGCGCYPAAIDMIRCNDDFCGSKSQVSFGIIAGNKYLIEVGGFQDKSGQGLMTITCEPASCPPSNDDCSNAQTIGDVWHLDFDVRCATFDGPGECMTGANIWYRYTAQCTGIVTVSTCGSEFDTAIAVYRGFDCTATNYTLIECNDDFPGCDLQSELTFETIEGQQYLIEVGGYDDETDRGELTIMCETAVPPTPPPVFNDDCSKARPVGDVKDLAFDTTDATFDGPGLCMTSPNLWYCYTATCTGNVTVSLCGSNFDTKLAVYEGCDCYLKNSDLIECNDDHPGCNLQSQITFKAIAGNQYLLEVGGYGQKKGQGLLNISCEGDAQVNLDFGDAPDSTNNFGKTMTAYTTGYYKITQANFPTVFNDGGSGPFGPFHRRPLTLAHLGQSVSLEVEADIGADQDGINNINPSTDSANKDGADDGVVLPLTLPNCGWATIDYIVNVIKPGTDIYVNIWLDFNRDGDWDDDSITAPAIDCGKDLYQNGQ